MTNHPIANQPIPIYTIGHATRSPAQVVALLQRYQIAFLIDVRPANATQPDTLAATLPAHQIRYVDMRAVLGKTAVYHEDEAYQHALGRLRTAFQQQQRVALLGEPLDPAACHRSQVIGAALTAWQIPVVHIDAAGELQPQPTPEQPPPVISPPATSPPATPQTILREIFGYEEFRPLQAQIVENILARRDTLVIMPTGGGKSLCYQLPALLFDGLTLVVSPLIALMQDQVDQLRQLGVAAAYLNSTLTAADYGAIAQQARQGRLKLLYMAPETLLREESLTLLAQSRLTALAIDEAHCISQWGHDFRPEYRQLVTVRQRFPEAVCIALTATATPRVQQDIKATLGLQAEDEFVASFDRKNLMIGVKTKIDPTRQVVDFVNAHPQQSGIIYCSTQRHVDDLAATLQANGISALPYHAGLETAVRQRNQRAFMVDDAPVIVATVAFGMGVDKPDVRFVLHVDLPQDMESYYQQIGRAGRDGDPAECLLFFGYGDVFTIQHFINEGADSEREGRMARLQQLVQWAESSDCRRRGLLAYFGEVYEGDNCGQCDSCLRPDAAPVDLTIPAQKFLSCVVRTGEKFGAGHIIQILRGSHAQNIMKWQHDRLSTHGIGQEYSDRAWKHLVQQFIQQGLLQHDLHYGTLSVSEEGWAVLRGQQVWGTLLEAEGVDAAATATPAELELLARLRSERKQVADAEGVAPYMIFADRALQEMATYLPHTETSFGAIYGVGQAKIARYAARFLPLIRAYCRERQLSERSKQSRSVVRVSSTKTRSDEVGELFTDGQSVEQIAEHFQVKRQTVISNLVKYVEAGNTLDGVRLQADSILTPEVQAKVLATFDELGDQYLKPIFEALGQTIPYDELHLLRLAYRQQRVVER